MIQYPRKCLPSCVAFSIIPKRFEALFGTDIFSDIDPDSKKIHVLIDDKDDYSPECSADYTGNDYNYLIIHEYDLDVNNKDYFFSTFSMNIPTMFI